MDFSEDNKSLTTLALGGGWIGGPENLYGARRDGRCKQ
jgi:hypothetical protein